MRTTILVFGLLVIFAACKKKKPDGCGDTFKYTFGYNKQIDTVHSNSSVFITINPGSNTVFSYEHNSGVCSMAADAGYTELLVFQLSPSVGNNFQFADAQLGTISCYYFRSCFCAGVTAKPVTSGSISGSRLSAATWLIHADILLPGSNNRIVFSREFNE